MILHSKKLIFVHIPRTAGTSVTQFLKKHFNALEKPEHLDLYKKNMSKKGYSKKFIENVLSQEKFKQNVMNYKYAKHSTAQDYFNLYGKEIFDSYFKFSIIRNPWERMISWYMHPQAGIPFKENEFIQWLRLKERDNQIKFLKINGDITVDKICRYENLTSDLSEIFKRIDIPNEEIDNLPVINKSIRGPYRGYYNNSSKKLVKEMFAEEIEKFNYNF